MAYFATDDVRTFNSNIDTKLRLGKPVITKRDRMEAIDNKVKGEGVVYNVAGGKKANSKSKQNKLPTDEWFVYLVDGEKWYYKVFVNVDDLLVNHAEVIFLGIGRPNAPVHKPNFPPKYLTEELKRHINPTQKRNATVKTCCYCEIPLGHKDNRSPNSETKDHLRPRSRGGSSAANNIRPCCYECNQEKGGLMLHSYIQLLNMMLLDRTGADLNKLQTKIKNANRLAKEIENE